METITHKKNYHIGRRIVQVRKLRDLTQDDLGKGLGISKQAVSKLEQSDEIEEQRLIQIAQVLGVTVEGLKAYNEESVIYNTNNFYDTTTFTGSTVAANIENINNPIEKIIELYESLLKSEREKVQILQNKHKE